MRGMNSDEDLMRLATQAGADLLDAERRLVTAESCTGGWVAQAVDRYRRAARLGTTAAWWPIATRSSNPCSACGHRRWRHARRGQRGDGA